MMILCNIYSVSGLFGIADLPAYVLYRLVFSHEG
jgi:hypothetical protein